MPPLEERDDDDLGLAFRTSRDYPNGPLGDFLDIEPAAALGLNDVAGVRLVTRIPRARPR